MKKLCLLAWALLLSGTAHAEDPFSFDLTDGSEDGEDSTSSYNFRFTNSIEARMRKFIRHDDFLSSRLRLNSSFLYETEWSSLYVNGFFDYDESVRKYDRRFRATLYELYAKINGSSAGMNGTVVSLGKMRLSWGVNDGRSTVDMINATYMKDPLANGRTVFKWPAWLARVEQSSALGNLEGVLLPFGKDRQMAEYGSPWEPEYVHNLRSMADSGQLSLTEHMNPRKVEWGVRYVKYMTGFDFGASYYSGFSDLPCVKYRGGNMFLLEPVRSRTAGVNVAMSLGSSTLRAELSMTADAPVYDRSGGLYYSDLHQVIVGWDRNFDFDIYANLQCFSDHYLHAEDDFGMTASLSQKYFNDSLNAGVNALWGRGREHTLEVYSEYAVSDSLTVSLRGFWIGGGSSSSIYRSYDGNDYAEFGFKYYF